MCNKSLLAALRPTYSSNSPLFCIGLFPITESEASTSWLSKGAASRLIKIGSSGCFMLDLKTKNRPEAVFVVAAGTYSQQPKWQVAFKQRVKPTFTGRAAPLTDRLYYNTNYSGCNSIQVNLCRAVAAGRMRPFLLRRLNTPMQSKKRPTPPYSQRFCRAATRGCHREPTHCVGER